MDALICSIVQKLSAVHRVYSTAEEIIMFISVQVMFAVNDGIFYLFHFCESDHVVPPVRNHDLLALFLLLRLMLE